MTNRMLVFLIALTLPLPVTAVLDAEERVRSGEEQALDSSSPRDEPVRFLVRELMHVSVYLGGPDGVVLRNRFPFSTHVHSARWFGPHSAWVITADGQFWEISEDKATQRARTESPVTKALWRDQAQALVLTESGDLWSLRGDTVQRDVQRTDWKISESQTQREKAWQTIRSSYSLSAEEESDYRDTWSPTPMEDAFATGAVTFDWEDGFLTASLCALFAPVSKTSPGGECLAPLTQRFPYSHAHSPRQAPAQDPSPSTTAARKLSAIPGDVEAEGNGWKVSYSWQGKPLVFRWFRDGEEPLCALDSPPISSTTRPRLEIATEGEIPHGVLRIPLELEDGETRDLRTVECITRWVLSHRPPNASEFFHEWIEGPADFWTTRKHRGTGESQWTLWMGLERIGTIPSGAELRFARSPTRLD